jgi:hypothetical protein
MYLSENHYLVNHEQHLDRLRNLEHRQLCQVAGWQGFSSKLYQETVSRLGIQLVNWGTKLQSFQNPDTGCQEAPVKMSITAR